MTDTAHTQTPETTEDVEVIEATQASETTEPQEEQPLPKASPERIEAAVEALLFAAEKPIAVKDIMRLLRTKDGIACTGGTSSKEEVNKSLENITERYASSALNIVKVASGYRTQVRSEYADMVARLWDVRAPRYSRAFMETLSLIAYRQPVTRGEIEEVRGVAVSTNIIRGLLERNWIRVVGHKNVPGNPALFATTTEFLDYFNLQKLEDLPPLTEMDELAPAIQELDLQQKTDESTDGSGVTDDAEPAPDNVVKLNIASDDSSADVDENSDAEALDVDIELSAEDESTKDAS